jgi:hypothetical protein
MYHNNWEAKVIFRFYSLLHTKFRIRWRDVEDKKAHAKLLGLSFLLGFIISLGKIMGQLSVFLFPVSS